VTQIR